MNLTHFHPRSIKNFGKKQQLSQHQIYSQSIRHQKYIPQNIRSDVKIS